MKEFSRVFSFRPKDSRNANLMTFSIQMEQKEEEEVYIQTYKVVSSSSSFFFFCCFLFVAEDVWVCMNVCMLHVCMYAYSVVVPTTPGPS